MYNVLSTYELAYYKFIFYFQRETFYILFFL